MTLATEPPATPAARRFGGQSMTAPLREALVKAPGPAFGRAFENPAHGFLHPVDLEVAKREHAAFVDLLSSLGTTVHLLETEVDSPDLLYAFDPLLITDRGAIPLRPGKAQPADRGRADRGVDARSRDPDGRADRGAGHDRGRRHDLAPAGSVRDRANAADEPGRGRPARRAGGRRRPDIRCSVLARPRGPRPPHVAHPPDRGRPRGRGPAAPPGRAVAAPAGHGLPAASRSTRPRPTPAATTCSSSGLAW